MDKRTQERIDKVRKEAETHSKRILADAENKAKQIEVQAQHSEQVRKDAEALRARLEDEHNVNRPHITQAKRDMLWSKAWEHGHAYGLTEVTNWYSDLVDLIT